MAETGDAWQSSHVPGTAQIWEIKAVRVDVASSRSRYRDITEQVDQQDQLERSAGQARAAADRTTALQTVDAALAAASTPDEVYLAMGTVVRPSAGGHGSALCC